MRFITRSKNTPALSVAVERKKIPEHVLNFFYSMTFLHSLSVHLVTETERHIEK